MVSFFLLCALLRAAYGAYYQWAEESGWCTTMPGEREHKTSLDKIFPVPLALCSMGLLSPKIDLFLLKRNQKRTGAKILQRLHYFTCYLVSA